MTASFRSRKDLLKYPKPKPQRAWDKLNPMARKCQYCKSQKPGMQPLRLYDKNTGKVTRGYWHLKCFEKAKKELEK